MPINLSRQQNSNDWLTEHHCEAFRLCDEMVKWRWPMVTPLANNLSAKVCLWAASCAFGTNSTETVLMSFPINVRTLEFRFLNNLGDTLKITIFGFLIIGQKGEWTGWRTSQSSGFKCPSLSAQTRASDLQRQWLVGDRAARRGISYNAHWQSYGEERETFRRCLCGHPAPDRIRLRTPWATLWRL